MDSVKDFSALEKTNKLLTKTIDIENDYQESLQAYNDDIYKVVKCISNNYITSIEVDSNEIKLHIKCEIYLTYYNDNSSLCYCDFEEEYTKTISVDSLSKNAFVNTRINDKYTNFRLINQRRIDIHSSSTISIEVFDKVKIGMLTEYEGAKLKKEKIISSEIKSCILSKLEFDEEFSVNQSNASIKRIISSSSNVFITDIKVIKDKVFVKSAVNLCILYTADSQNEEIIKNDYSFNASKIIDIRGIEENDTIIPEIKVGNVFLKAKSQGSDNINTISAFGELSLKLTVICEKENEIITDGYLKDNTCICNYCDLSYYSSGKALKESKLFNVNVKVHEDLAEIKEMSLITGKCSQRGNSIINDITVNILYINTSGEICFESETAAIEYKTDGFELAVSSIIIKNYDYSLSSNGLDLRVSCELYGYVYNSCSIKILNDIQPQDEEINLPSLIVYFGRKDEEIWNIAKRFVSDTELIKFENSLEEDFLKDNKLLIIPRA